MTKQRFHVTKLQPVVMFIVQSMLYAVRYYRKEQNEKYSYEYPEKRDEIFLKFTENKQNSPKPHFKFLQPNDNNVFDQIEFLAEDTKRLPLTFIQN